MSLFNFLFKNCESNSHFVKNANVTKIRRRQNSNFGFIFEAGTKSTYDVWEKCIFLDVMQEFCPSFKNETKIWLFDTALFLWLHFHKVVVTLTIFKQKFEREPEVWHLFSDALEKIIFFSILHFCQIIDFTLFLC